jgi:hypothetical protein
VRRTPVSIGAAFRCLTPLCAAFERADRDVRQWPAAGLALLVIAVALVGAVHVTR